MNNNMTGFRYFSKISVLICLDERRLSIRRVKTRMTNRQMALLMVNKDMHILSIPKFSETLQIFVTEMVNLFPLFHVNFLYAVWSFC